MSEQGPSVLATWTPSDPALSDGSKKFGDVVMSGEI